MTTGTTEQPELGGTIPFRVDQLPDDQDGQVAATIALMCLHQQASAATPELQRDLAACQGGDLLGAIHRFVRSHLRFRDDDATAAGLSGIPPADIIEVLVPPVDLSRAIAAGLQPHEDCDGFSMYVAALLTAAGIPCSFVTVAGDPADPTHYTHVYVAAYPAPGLRIPIDASHGDYAGWECPNRFNRRREWPATPAPHRHLLIPAVLLAATAMWAASGRIAA